MVRSDYRLGQEYSDILVKFTATVHQGERMMTGKVDGRSKRCGGEFMRIRIVGFAILALTYLTAAVGLYGQEIRGSIVGNVTDSTGAAVPGTRITVKNEATGIEYRSTTDTSGTYTVPDLLAGTYTVIAVKEGFRTFEATGVQLLSSQTARQDVVLQVGAVVQTLEVAGHAQLVQTDSPTVGGTLQTRELADLPFQTTSTDGLMNLVPGMSQGITNGNSNPDIGGAAYVGMSNWTVNGISTNNPGQGGEGTSPISALPR